MSLCKESNRASRLKTVGGECELDQNLEILRQIPVFSGVPLDRLRLYAYLGKRICYPAGQFLFHQGELDDRGYIILCGRAQIIREYNDRFIILNELKEGDFFGGLALLAEIRRLFSCRAITDLECLTLDRESFRKILTLFPEVTIRVLDVMIKRIVSMEDKLLSQNLSGHFHD